MKNSTLIINGIKCKAVTKATIKFKRIRVIHFLKAIFLVFLLLCTTQVFSACIKNEKAVLEAYELRISGKVDEAKTRLENILNEEPGNAMAHFELARTLNYIHMRGSEEADLHLKKAIEHDPGNVIYAFYSAHICFLKAYVALQSGGDDSKELVGKACSEYLNVLEMKTDYAEPLLYLVEIYGMLPENLGGDKKKAEEYARRLEKLDAFYGAKGRLVMMPEGTDMVQYWQDFIEQNGESGKALKELGVACIFKDEIESAKKHFEKAMAKNKDQNIRLLDLARYHQMKVMRNRELAAEELPTAIVYTQKYLESSPEPIAPMKAYAMGMLAKSEMFLGNREAGQKIMQEAKAIDPYFSRAFGIPSPSIFEAPDKFNFHFSSFFSPY